MMATFLNYLLVVSLWFIPLYLLYLVLYKRFTFFRLNRIYLIAIALSAFVLPFIKYEIVKKETVIINAGTPNPFHNLNPVPADPETETNIPATTTTIREWIIGNAGSLLFLFYILVAIILSFRLFRSLYKIRKAVLASKGQWKNNIRLVYSKTPVPHSSFFRYIFLPDSAAGHEDLDKIILHEMQHHEKLHSLDVLFCELLKIILWFNPFVYWYKQSLQEVHEFEVDAEMTKVCNEMRYAELLLQVAGNRQAALVNAFSTRPLKTRLKMIFNRKTYPMKKLTFLAVIPLLAVFLMAYGNIKQRQVPILKQPGHPFTILIDAGHGGNDHGAVGINGIYEKDLCLKIAQKFKSKAEAAGYKVIMSRAEDVAVDLKSRTRLTETENVDLLISIHHNSAANDANKNGIECFTGSNNNPLFSRQSVSAGKLMLESLQNINGLSTDPEPKSRTAGIWILKASNCPAVLIEIGYLSNSKDLAFISNPENQSLLAEQLTDGVTQFLKTNQSLLTANEQENTTVNPAAIQYPDTLVWIKDPVLPKKKQQQKNTKPSVQEQKKISPVKNEPNNTFRNRNDWLQFLKKENC
jgi:N-acetylmuramoyl-L-alanine amidase